MEYLENAGISRAVLLNLFRDQPTFVLSAVDHKVVTDQAASFIKAAYMVQNEQRVEYALKVGGAVTRGSSDLTGGEAMVNADAARECDSFTR